MLGERDPKFYSELKQMNEDLIKFLQTTHDVSPYFDFTPTINSYVKQMSDLEKQYPEKNASLPQPSTNAAPPPQQTPKLGISFPTINQPTAQPTTTQAAANPFGTASSIFSSSVTTQPFLFGAPSTQNLTSTATTTGTSGFSFSFGPAAKKDETSTTNTSIFGSSASTTIAAPSADTNDNNGQTEGDNEEDDVPPPEPQIDKYEEPGASHSVRVKMYEKTKSSDGLVLVGIGMLYVKNLSTPNKLQLILRQEPDMMRVLFNHMITSNIPMKKMPKAVTMVVPSATGESKSIIFKLKEDQEAENLYNVISAIKNY